jgi:hypothetical protein
VEQLVAIPGPGAGEVTISMPYPGLHSGPWRYDVEVRKPDQSVRTWVAGRLIVEGEPRGD